MCLLSTIAQHDTGAMAVLHLPFAFCVHTQERRLLASCAHKLSTKSVVGVGTLPYPTFLGMASTMPRVHLCGPTGKDVRSLQANYCVPCSCVLARLLGAAALTNTSFRQAAA